MIAKFDDSLYIDVDSITFISGNYTDKDKTKWRTDIVVGGQGIGVTGQSGKNVLEAFLWKHKNSIYDMIHDSETYKKTIK